MRLSFSEEGFDFPLPNLSAIQLESYDAFLKGGVNDILEEINDVEDYTGRGWVLSFANPRFDNSTITIQESIDRGTTYSAPWYLKTTLFEKETKKSKTQEIYMGEVPLMTPKGTFIINGIEKVVVNQLTRSEGAYFVPLEYPGIVRPLASAKLLPKNGAWLEIETLKNNVLAVKIDRKRKVVLSALLRVFGLETDNQIREAFAEAEKGSEVSYIENTLEKDPSSNYDEALIEIYRKIRPGEPLILDNAKTLVETMFFNPRRYSLGKVGRFKFNQRLGTTFANDPEGRLLHKEDLIKVVEKIIALNRNLGEEFDDIDHLGNRRVRSVGELLQNQIRIGFLQMERNIKERMSLQPRGELCEPGALISTRPVSAKVHSFFASGQLSQYQDQSNPLTGLDHLRRLSVMGPGGLTKERASFSVRDAHYTHYGKICPVRTPEGPNIGLITYIALYARVNEYGFLETPYRKIVADGKGSYKVTNTVEYLAAYDEEKYYITDASAVVSRDGKISETRVPLRKGKDFFIGDISMASYMDINSQQTVGVAASLIPFISNTDVIRALYGCQQATQAVPLISPQAPFVGTGMEGIVAQNSGAIIEAPFAGVTEYADAERIVFKGKEKVEYKIQKFVQSNMDTCYNQKVNVVTGQKVKQDAILAEGPAVSNGEMAIGANLTVAFMIWHGYNYEDAIIISDRLVKDDILTSIHIKDHSVQVLETKLGPEEITRDIPNVSEEALRNLDENGIVAVGSEVKSGDILVGKIAPKGETELSAEERLLRAIFGEKSRDVKDNSLVLPHGEYGTVISVTELSKERGDELPTGVVREIRVFVAQRRKIVVGDKLTGRQGQKGVIALIAREEDMPFTQEGVAADIILHPASLLGRMNIGQLPETHLGWVSQKTGNYYKVPVFSKFNESYLIKALKDANLPTDGKTVLYDGRTGEPFDTRIVVGSLYVLKLHHLAEDKMHARSTGPYSLITQQPLGGKAQFGGQRFGEMEVWALEAYSAAHVLQEMLTIKSDDMLGRTLAYRAMLQGEKIPPAAIPESFKLLVRELNGLCLNIETVGESQEEVEEVELAGIVPGEAVVESEKSGKKPKVVELEVVLEDKSHE
ncbi:MAG: DNA-directed RNA polymerase subunit beta [Patescibacteria group bacterium]